MSNNEQEYRMVNGQKVPVMSAKGTITIKNKRTGAAYTSKAHFDEDVANPDTDTKNDDFRQDVSIRVAEVVLKE
jgi:hypothetical protein|tara:strand:+ start:563 stop:784 length:222 start_codon:yes stop_codon:yes gene_type:complete